MWSITMLKNTMHYTFKDDNQEMIMNHYLFLKEKEKTKKNWFNAL